MYELLSVPHESEVMSMRKGIYGIFSNVSYSNFAFRPKTQKQRLKENAWQLCQSVFFSY